VHEQGGNRVLEASYSTTLQHARSIYSCMNSGGARTVYLRVHTDFISLEGVLECVELMTHGPLLLSKDIIIVTRSKRRV
jgi:hypothetical protein